MRAAIAALGSLGPTRASSLWRSEPLGDPDQPWYVNAVVELELDAASDPHALLARLRALERAAGRPDARPKNSPRVLDLDLLLFGDAVVKSAELTVPHPGLTPPPLRARAARRARARRSCRRAKLAALPPCCGTLTIPCESRNSRPYRRTRR